MDNGLFSNSDTLHPGDFEPGSIESRAAARAVLADPARPPIIVTEYSEPVLDAEGRHIYGGRVCDSKTAVISSGSMDDKILERQEGESLDAFRQRACLEVPALQGGQVRMRWDG